MSLAPFAWGARHRHPVDRGTVKLLVVSGVFLAIHFALFLGSLAFTTVASSTTLATMSPIFVALGGAWFLDERPDRRTWIGMGLTMTGAVAIGLADAGQLALGPRALLGDAMAFASALSVTVYLLIGRRTRGSTHASIYSGVVYAAASVVLVGICLVGGAPLWGYTPTQWWALAGLIAGPQLLGHTVFNTLMSSIPAHVVSISVLAEPLVATVLAWWLLEQLPAPLFFAAAPLVLVGVAMAVLRRQAGGRPDRVSQLECVSRTAAAGPVRGSATPTTAPASRPMRACWSRRSTTSLSVSSGPIPRCQPEAEHRASQAQRRGLPHRDRPRRGARAAGRSPARPPGAAPRA